MGRSINYQNQNRKKGLHIVVIVVVAVVALSQLGTNGINGLALPCKLAPMNHNRCDTTTQLFSALHAVHHNGKGLQQRRAFIQKSILGGVAAATTAMKFNSAASAATPAVPSTSSSSSSKKKMPTIYTTEKGVKYVITKDAPSGSKTPQSGDIVAVEYTGYLTSEQIFDSTHAEGKSNALLFTLKSDAVIPGLEDVITKMSVGMKVQAIIPPNLAFGDKGICLEDKPTECLIRPGSTLVYDVFLKKSSIPPP